MRLFHFRADAFKVPLAYVIPAVLFLIVMAAFPQIDILVSRHYFDPAQGGFYLGRNFWIDAAGNFTSMASAVFVLGCFLFYGLGKLNKRVYMGMDKRLVAYFGLVLVIGPLLFVTLGFKELWGRPRPEDITQFGGVEQFMPYYQPSHACDTDCSFPSGHTARGFVFIALAFAAYGLQRSRFVARSLVVASVSFGLATGFMRIIEGKHFLTDVVCSIIIVTYSAWVLYRLMWPPNSTEEPTP